MEGMAVYDPTPSPAQEVTGSSEPVVSRGTDDDALILWMLSLTPTERLRAAQSFVNGIQALSKTLG
jgi:hypothetical protein